jgi:hypothetical protein
VIELHTESPGPDRFARERREEEEEEEIIKF